MKDIRRTLKVLYRFCDEKPFPCRIICSTADTSGVSGMVYKVNKITWKKRRNLHIKRLRVK